MSDRTSRPAPASSPPTSLAIPSHMPSDWPVVERGLIMGYIGPVLVIRISAIFPESSFERYLVEWTRSVDARPNDAAIFALYDIRTWPGMSAVQRRRWGEMLKSREATLRRTTRGMVLASAAPITRAAVRAVFWIAPPPYPHAVVSTTRAGFDEIERLGGPWAEGARNAYDSFVERHWRGAERATSMPPPRAMPG